MAVLSLGWLGTAAIGKLQQGDEVVSLWEGYHDPLAWLVLLWPAIGQYSTGEAAQVAGQARYAQLLCKLPLYLLRLPLHSMAFPAGSMFVLALQQIVHGEGSFHCLLWSSSSYGSPC